MQNRYQISSIEETRQLANKLASKVRKAGTPQTIILKGELGAGKTEFVRAFINAFFEEEIDVISPTFNLLQIYSPKGEAEIYHYDLYRLQDVEEVYELGIEDAFDENIVLIEWADIIKDILPQNTIYINIEKLQGQEAKRVIEIVNCEW